MKKIKKILIAEDEKQICDLLGKFLTRHGFKIVKAFDGKHCLEMAHNELPDLILLDIKMPEPDGIEICRQLKHDPRTKETVIFLLTAKAELYDRRLGLAAGADAYLTKPALPAEIISKINALQTD